MASGASAQAPPPPPTVNPSGIEQEQQRQQQRLEQRIAPPKQTGPGVVGPSRAPADLLKPGGPKIKLKKVEFDGESKFLSKEELDAAIAPYLGKTVDFSDLQKLTAAINALYAEKGVVTGIATLPPQNVNSGTLHIKLTEGKLEKMTVTGLVQTREPYIRDRIDAPAGQVLDVPKVSRDVTWFNRTNDVQVRALLQPGTSFGLTDVQLAVTEVPIDVLQVFYDNQGVKSTGRYEGGVYYRRSGTLGIDDRFTFYGTKSEDAGNLNGNVSYNARSTTGAAASA